MSNASTGFLTEGFGLSKTHMASLGLSVRTKTLGVILAHCSMQRLRGCTLREIACIGLHQCWTSVLG